MNERNSRPLPRPPSPPTQAELKTPARGVLSAEIVRLATGAVAKSPPTMDPATVGDDLTLRALLRMPRSRWEAHQFEHTARSYANGWEHVNRGVSAMAEARNISALTYKKATEYLAAAAVIREDANHRCAQYRDDIALLEDGAAIREATRTERIALSIATLRAERRACEIEVAALDERSRYELANWRGHSDQERERNRLELEDFARRSRTARDQAQADISDKGVRAIYDKHVAPVTFSSAESEDELDRLLRGLGTFSSRKELKSFLRPALMRDFLSHDLAPMVYYIALRETSVGGKSEKDAISSAARTVLTYLERPRESWPKDISERFAAQIRELEAALKEEKRERLREALAKEESLFDGTQPFKMPPF